MAETTSEKKTTAKKTASKKTTKKAAEEVVEVAQETPVVGETPVTEEMMVEATTKVLEQVTDEEPDVQDSGDVMFGQAPEAQEDVVDKTEPDVEKVLEDVKVEEEPENEEVKADEEIMAETLTEFDEAKKTLEEKVEALTEQDDAEAVIKSQIKNLEAIKAKTEKIARKYSNYQVSNTWNGMIQDW